MKRITPVVVLTLSVLLLSVGPWAAVEQAQASGNGEDCSFPYDRVDATGAEVSLDSEPERVVTLNPSAAQTMWEIGAEDKVVGLTEHATYLEGAEEKENVSGAGEIVVVEEVVDADPDLVLAPNATSTETVDQLRGAGVTVYHFFEDETVEDVYEKTRTIGRLTGECDGADETVAWMQDRIEVVRTAVEDEQRPVVLYEFFGYTAGDETFIHEIVETAGGDNVAADYDVSGYRELNDEVVVESDPDWIVRNSNDPVVPEGAPFDSTTAVREGQVVVVPIEHLNQAGPRIVHAITTLAEHFHPEAYADANATATESPESSTDAPAETQTQTGSTTVTDGQPGIGVVAALLAVAIAVAAAGSRR